jgi:MSHA biogenesis protein MshK
VSDRAAFALAALLAVMAARADELAPPRDPMQPFGAAASGAGRAAATGPRFRLTAVVISDARRVAVVNGKSYQPGESVDGAEVIRIESQSVHLRDGGQDLVIHLGRTGIRTPPASQGETAQ